MSGWQQGCKFYLAMLCKFILPTEYILRKVVVYSTVVEVENIALHEEITKIIEAAFLYNAILFNAFGAESSLLRPPSQVWSDESSPTRPTANIAKRPQSFPEQYSRTTWAKVRTTSPKLRKHHTLLHTLSSKCWMPGLWFRLSVGAQLGSHRRVQLHQFLRY